MQLIAGEYTRGRQKKDAAGIPLAKYAEMCTPQIPKLFFLSVENISFIMTQRQIKF